MKVFFSRIFAIALVLVLTATGLWAGGAERGAGSPRPKSARWCATGNRRDDPRAPLRGSLSYAAKSFPPSSDPWFTHHANPAVNGVNEKLAIGDWANRPQRLRLPQRRDSAVGLPRLAGRKLGDAGRTDHGLHHARRRVPGTTSRRSTGAS